MFLFAPFFIWLYDYDKKLGKWILFLALVILMAVLLIVSFVNKVMVFPIADFSSGFTWYYSTTYTRATPYFLGLLLACFYSEWKSAKKDEERDCFARLVIKSRIFRIFLSLFGIGIVTFCTLIVSPV